MNRTDWFYEAGFGLFVHWTPRSLPQYGEQKPHAQAILDFDLDTFVSQVVEAKAKFVFFTISHAHMHLPFPLKELDEIVPNHTSTRDLISEMADALAKHGIKLMVYFNGDGCMDPEWNVPTKTYTDGFAHAEYCYKIAEAVSKKYGSKINGWWIDCCYTAGICSEYGKYYDYERYANAMRAGNENSIVAFNYRGVEPWGCDWGKGIADYQAGEMNDLAFYPSGRFSGEGDTQWFGLCWMDKFWVNETEGEPVPVHSNEKVLEYVKTVRENGGVFAYNVAPWQEGRISEKTMQQLRFLAENM